MGTVSIDRELAKPLSRWLRYLAIGCISAVPMATVFSLTHNVQWVCFTASLLLFCLCNQPRLAVGSVVVLAVSLRMMSWQSTFLSHTYDYLLWRTDARLGFDPWTAIVFFESTRWLYMIGAFVYLGFMLAIAIASVVSSEPTKFWLKTVTASAMAYLIYFMVPACGPRYLMTSTVGAPRNAMPSMHTTWALMIWYEMRGKNLAIRLVADMFLLFTVIATVGSGEHYVVDLIAAVPFTALIEWLLA